MRILTYTVQNADEGRMVKGLLRGELQLSYTLLKSLKWRENAILLNGQNVHVNARVHAGDVVSVVLSERAECGAVLPADAPAPQIVYEDEDLLVLNKPAGVAMHPKAGSDTPNLAAMVTNYLGAGSVPHFVSRLDKGTSGLLIAAKSGYIHDRLRRALHSNALHREYRAVAVGKITPPCGTIDTPIGRAEGSIIRRCVRPDGLPSRTVYETLQTNERFTLLRLCPQTGRTHQLRVHLSHLGYPLAGDWLYGIENASLIARPALHSYELWFTHPVSEKELHFTLPIPEDMARLMQ